MPRPPSDERPSSASGGCSRSSATTGRRSSSRPWPPSPPSGWPAWRWGCSPWRGVHGSPGGCPSTTRGASSPPARTHPDGPRGGRLPTPVPGERTLARVTDLIDTTEMYLRTVFELEAEGITPLRARIAERLHQSGPTVSQTVARMERDGLLTVEGDRHLQLSDEGRSLATAVMRKHRLAECLLVDVIG